MLDKNRVEGSTKTPARGRDTMHKGEVRDAAARTDGEFRDLVGRRLMFVTLSQIIWWRRGIKAVIVMRQRKVGGEGGEKAR